MFHHGNSEPISGTHNGDEGSKDFNKSPKIEKVIKQEISNSKFSSNDSVKHYATASSEQNISMYDSSENPDEYSDHLITSSISRTPSSESIYNEKRDFVDNEDPKIDVILSHKQDSDRRFYFFVKYVGKPYKSATWIPEPTSSHAQKKIRKYLSKHLQNPPQPPYYRKEYDIPEKILSHRKLDGIDEYLTLWTDLDRKDATWETKESLNNDKLIEDFYTMPSAEEIENHPKPPPSSWQPITDPPTSKSGKVLRNYQVDGLNFLTNSWFHNHNAIIADEMGLGKTAQVCSFLNHLYKEEHQYGPYLIIVPLSTIDHWKREIFDWTDLKVLVFQGSKQERRDIIAHELKYEGTEVLRFQVLLTTSDIVLRSSVLWSSFPWVALIFDEAHRLKSQSSKLLNIIKEFHAVIARSE